MADTYEVTLTLDLRDEVSEEELAELRWHLGLGPKPEVLRIVTDFSFGYVDDDGELVIEDHTRPLLGRHGAPRHLEGALVSVLVPREHPWRGAWALTSRQELHPDEFELTGELLSWLATKAGDFHRATEGTVELGRIRFHATDQARPLIVRDGAVIWP